MIEKIILKKSAVLDKMPTAEQLDYGEIALNFNTMNPFISFRDTADGIRQIRDYSDEIQNINGYLTDARNEINYLRPLVTDNHTNLMFLRSDFEDFKIDNTKTINELHTDNDKNTDAIATKADKTDLETKVSKTDIVQSTGTSTTAVMSQKAVSDALANGATKSEFEYCGLMEWDGKNEVKIYEMKFDSPKREVFIYGLCTWDNTNRGQFKIIITNEKKYPYDSYGISYFNSSSMAEECFHIHNVCGNYVCDINASNNHLVPNALKRCYMRNLLTDQNHKDVGLITNLKIEITTDLVRIDGVQKWYVFGI